MQNVVLRKRNGYAYIHFKGIIRQLSFLLLSVEESFFNEKIPHVFAIYFGWYMVLVGMCLVHTT